MSVEHVAGALTEPGSKLKAGQSLCKGIAVSSDDGECFSIIECTACNLHAGALTEPESKLRVVKWSLHKRGKAESSKDGDQVANRNNWSIMCCRSTH